jgi:dTMP kinase
MMDDRSGVPLIADLAGLVLAPRRRNARGLFIAFEGGEGAGKSTQVALLAEWLRERGHPVLTTREPGATSVGQALRATLLDSHGQVDPHTEALLYAADRAQHVAEVIVPALDRGQVVVTDRYVDSSLAYQGAGRDLPTGDVARLSQWATAGLVPDLTILLDVDPQLGLTRLTGPADRIEADTVEFHDRVRRRFLELARRRSYRYLVVDATLPPQEIASRVRERVQALLPAASRSSVTPTSEPAFDR